MDVFTGLDEEFAVKAKEVLAICKNEHGIIMKPYSGVRSPVQQAATWMQGRSRKQQTEEVQKLRGLGAHYLADVLAGANLQAGNRVTGALPGFSWHQWSEALDCVWLKNGKTGEWTDLRGYKIYANVARKLGLTAGDTFGDYPHIQKRKASGPHKQEIVIGGPYPEGTKYIDMQRRIITLKELDAEMQKRFAA